MSARYPQLAHAYIVNRALMRRAVTALWPYVQADLNNTDMRPEKYQSPIMFHMEQMVFDSCAELQVDRVVDKPRSFSVSPPLVSQLSIGAIGQRYADNSHGHASALMLLSAQQFLAIFGMPLVSIATVLSLLGACKLHACVRAKKRRGNRPSWSLCLGLVFLCSLVVIGVIVLLALAYLLTMFVGGCTVDTGQRNQLRLYTDALSRIGSRW